MDSMQHKSRHWIALFAVACIAFNVSLPAGVSTEDPAPTTGVSVNIVNLFWQYINTSTGGRPAAVKAMQDAYERGFTFYRFAASAFWPNELQLWFNTTTRQRYWESFDALVEDAKRIGACPRAQHCMEPFCVL